MKNIFKFLASMVLIISIICVDSQVACMQPLGENQKLTIENVMREISHIENDGDISKLQNANRGPFSDTEFADVQKKLKDQYSEFIRKMASVGFDVKTTIPTNLNREYVSRGARKLIASNSKAFQTFFIVLKGEMLRKFLVKNIENKIGECCEHIPQKSEIIRELHAIDDLCCQQIEELKSYI